MARSGGALLAGTLVLLMACGGGDGNPGADTTGMAAPPPAAEPATPAPGAGQDTGTAAPAPSTDTSSAAAPAGEAAAPAQGGGGGTPEQVALGDKIFHGQEGGGTCIACHGQDAKGTPMAPDLTDGEWLVADGSLASIKQTITSGVPQPKSHPAPMPPMGGASLTPEQVDAVAAYVYSLSHKS